MVFYHSFKKKNYRISIWPNGMRNSSWICGVLARPVTVALFLKVNSFHNSCKNSLLTLQHSYTRRYSFVVSSDKPCGVTPTFLDDNLMYAHISAFNKGISNVALRFHRFCIPTFIVRLWQSKVLSYVESYWRGESRRNVIACISHGRNGVGWRNKQPDTFAVSIKEFIIISFENDGIFIFQVQGQRQRMRKSTCCC